MLLILYILSIIGSFSVGYSLMRIGYPEVQKKDTLEKIGYGYLLGLIVFLPSILTIFFTSEKFFFLFATGAYGFLLIIMLIIRTYYKKEDTVELIKPNKKRFIPNKVLTDEEKEKIQANNDEENDSDIDDDTKDYENFKKEKASELNVSEKLSKVNHSSTGKFQSGLFVKGYNNENKKEEHIFKEKDRNVISELRNKTIGVSDDKKVEVDKSKNEKDQAFAELKGLAKKLNKKKEQNNDELEELNEINEDF